MSLIATLVEQSGVARIFFDLRPNESYLDDQRRITAVIEEAFALAATAAGFSGIFRSRAGVNR
jgi:hypothetical protein